ncbi:MAG: L,D-transpeptidase family protein [Acetobacteraceae bacterium]|nr:L,D-transpeptidase family protein [Acetobacteraceae bacterium]
MPAAPSVPGSPAAPAGGASSLDWLPCPGPPFATGLVLNLPAFELRFYRGGELVAVYPVAIGQPQHPTPVGDFSIKHKVVDPTWYPPGGGSPVPPGPSNPLGSKWLGLSLEHYGMHGTNQPESIGRPVSLGCVRLSEAGIAELFGQVAVGTPVSIVYRPVEVWRHRLTGERAVRVYPDVYGLGGVGPEALAGALEQEGMAAAGLLEGLLSRLGPLPPPGPAPVEARLGVPIRFNGRFLGLGLPCAGGPPLVPLRPLAEALGAALDYDAASGRALVEGWPVEGLVVESRTFLTPAAASAVLGVGWAWDAAGAALDVSRVQVTVDSYPVAALGLVWGGRVLVEPGPVAQALGCPVSPGPSSGVLLVGETVLTSLWYDGRPLVLLEELAGAAGARAYWYPEQGLAALVSPAWAAPPAPPGPEEEAGEGGEAALK